MPPDPTTLNRAIHAIYAAAVLPEQWPAALDAIAACFDGVGTALLLRRGGDRMSTIVSPALTVAAKAYEAGAWKLDFYIPRAIERTVVEPHAIFTDRNLGTPEEIATHPFYTEFRRPHGLGPFLGTQILPHPQVTAILTVQGRLSRETFSDPEMAVYAAIARHAERALMLTVRLLEAETRSEALADALSRLCCGVFAIDVQGKVNFLNAAAERMLGAGLSLHDGCLALTTGQQGTLDLAIGTVNRGVFNGNFAPVHPLLAKDPGSGRMFALYMLPIGQELLPEIRETFLPSHVLVLVIEHGAGTPADPMLIRDLLGLSQGEARLASLIGAGQSPRQAAAKLGITEESARTVLKRVFVKTDTSRQSELAALLSRLAIGRNP
jgi:DNA-binding CsgD family transcriptional regulator/PAS domain-containing protein